MACNHLTIWHSCQLAAYLHSVNLMKNGCKPTGKAAHFQAIISCLNNRKTRLRVPSTPLTIFKQSCIVISISGQAVLMFIFHKTSLCNIRQSGFLFWSKIITIIRSPHPKTFPVSGWISAEYLCQVREKSRHLLKQCCLIWVRYDWTLSSCQPTTKWWQNG